MDNFLEDRISDREKTLAAMGAAMAGGCRKCADKLYEIAQSLGIAETEIGKAFQTGLEAKSEAAYTMREKVSSLVGAPDKGPGGGQDGKFSFFVRIASFTAANSAPDVTEEIRKAREHGNYSRTGTNMYRPGQNGPEERDLVFRPEISEQAGSFGFCNGGFLHAAPLHRKAPVPADKFKRKEIIL